MSASNGNGPAGDAITFDIADMPAGSVPIACVIVYVVKDEVGVNERTQEVAVSVRGTMRMLQDPKSLPKVVLESAVLAAEATVVAAKRSLGIK